MQSFGMSMLWFWASYAIVTCIGILHTIFNIYVLKMKPMDEHSMGEGYEKTKPWHPLYNIVLFSIINSSVSALVEYLRCRYLYFTLSFFYGCIL